jgi:hypothetical protein
MGSGGLMKSNDDSTSKVFVQYKFKKDETEYKDWLTKTQYKKLKSLSMIEYCKIISPDD